MIYLDNRLLTCAGFVTGNAAVCDIGTDHAYLPAFLIQENRCRRVIAADINDGPLQKARETINKLGINESVTLIKSNGLQNISLDGVSDIIIAGMGGENIFEIISRDMRIDCKINLILQPMTKEPALRCALYRYGYEIIAEKAALCGESVFIIINARYCGVKKKITSFYSHIGNLDSDNREAQAYLLKQAVKLNKEANGLLKTINGLDEALLKLRLVRRLLRRDKNI